MSTRSSFVEPGDVAAVGDCVVYHGDHGNLIRGSVADREISPLTRRTMYRVVDLASEMFDSDAGTWVPHEKLFMIQPLHDQREAL